MNGASNVPEVVKQSPPRSPGYEPRASQSVMVMNIPKVESR
jgi:hypothetical protein